MIGNRRHSGLRHGFRLGVIVGCLAVAGSLMAQAPQLSAGRCEHPPTMSSNPNDPAWRGAPTASAFVDLFTDKPVADQTECKVVFDEEALYALFICHDSKPDQIVGREINPESQFNGEDTVTLSIDPYNGRNGSSMSRFTVNAINTRTETIAGGHSSKAEWRGVWQSTTKRTSDGYVVEMRIPWRILNYPKSSKPIDMDVNFDRYQAHTKTNSQWAYVTPSYKPELLGLLKGVTPPKQDSRSRWQFLAYDAPAVNEGSLSNRAGLDARYAVTNEQTALLSLNPDFINIEQQIAGVDFVHTERLLSDARPFFTEGGDYFNPISQFEYGIPFYSQRIGPINFGTKFYGQLSQTAKLGTLAVNQTDGSTATFTNYSLNIGSTFSQAFYASSYDLGPQHDLLAGTTFNKRWGNWFVHNATAVEDTGHGTETAGNNAIGFTGPKLFSEIQQIWVDPSFNPPLAYVPWQNRRGAYTYTNFNDTIPRGPFHDWNCYLYTPNFHQSDGTIQERGVQGGVNFTTRDDQAISFNRSITDYQTGSDNTYDVSYAYNASNRFKQASIEYLFGQQNSATSRYINLRGSLRVFHRLDLGLSQSVLQFTPDARQTIATVGWQIDSRRSVTGRFVDTNGFQNFFLSYESAGWTGMEVYVILGDPNALTFSRILSLKFVWAF
ncbi:MAG: sugar-binding protein [Fimbriimonas sp.]|nr:sugar-binding protein [Fimbriimonas sp.]